MFSLVSGFGGELKLFYLGQRIDFGLDDHLANFYKIKGVSIWLNSIQLQFVKQFIY